ncbi:phosphotransferase [Brevibacterium casei]|uniref:phosphotransferase n=1 Tax=Brevibacterium casei TaxID=33889 RepID=UPI003159386D
MAAVAATMLDDFSPTTWTSLPPLDAGVRILISDGETDYVAAAHLRIDRSADAGSTAEAARIYETAYPHADFTWPHLRAITEVEEKVFGTDSPVTVTLSDPLPGAPVGDEPIADVARASSLAQTLATIHSAAPEPISDAGFPVEEPSRFQFQILERLDQAAATGRVPATLLHHWEEEFEKVALWHFLATPIHGALDESNVYTDEERVLALADIGRMRVADPAIDLAAASALIDPAAVPTFFTEYRSSRPRADDHIVTRAELLAEFAVLDWLLEAVESGDDEAIADAADLLTSFDQVLLRPDGSDVPTAPVSSDDVAQGSNVTSATEESADDHGTSDGGVRRSSPSGADRGSAGADRGSAGARVSEHASPGGSGHASPGGGTSGRTSAGDGASGSRSAGAAENGPESSGSPER